MRLFTALVPPEGAAEHLDEFLAPRREAAAFRWSSPEQWHVTLAFMGEAHDRHLDDLADRLARAARRRTPFTVRVAGGGAFPHPAGARVLFADLDLDPEARDELDRLATGARAAAVKSGVPVDGARFRPHVTLARLGHPAEVSNWVRLLDSYSGPEWVVEDIALVASHLGEGPRRRPRHEVLETFSLGG